MALGRPDISKPAANSIHIEVIDGLKQDLHGWMQVCIDEEAAIQKLEEKILAEGDINYDAQTIVPEDSSAEVMYEKVAPYFVSAKTFLKHLLDENKKQIKEASASLHELIGMSHERFALLSGAKQRKCLIDICVISAAILQDLRVLASKYVIEIDLCLTAEIIKEITLEKSINGLTTILFDMAMYHPDHQADFAAYRQELYAAIGSVDLSTQQFFTIMHGHVAAAMDFINHYYPELKQNSIEAEEAEEAEEQSVISKPLTQAMKFTALAPPVIEQAPVVDPVVPKTEENRRCAIL